MVPLAGPIGELQRRPLGFWSKVLPSSADNYSPLERQLLACYWVLVDTECLTMGHQVTMSFELPIMNWVTHQAIKLGTHSNTPSSNGKDVWVIGSEQAPKTQVSYMKKWPEYPRSPLLLHCLLFPARNCGLMGSSLPPVDGGRGVSSPVYRWVCTRCRRRQKVGSCSSAAPLWDAPEGPGEGNSFQWAELPAEYLAMHFAWKERCPGV